jgi:hypothetical protein
MNLPPAESAHNDELSGLIAAVWNGTIQSEQQVRLEALLAADPTAQERYLACMSLHAQLLWQYRGQTPETVQLFGIQQPPPPVSFPSSIPYGTVSYLSSSWPVAYLIATVVLGIGLAIGAVTHVSRSVQFAGLPSPVCGRGAGGEGGRTIDTAQSPVVGKVTGMVDCRWDKGIEVRDKRSEADFHPSSLIPHPSSPVSLGDKFALLSGLLEITYDTGAKVILQGPVTYEVESPAGGFLSIGKLTARVDNSKTKDQRPKTEDPNPKSPNLQISKFVIRTPSATVTDLGTEFGVEVSKTGDVTSHVFRGMVEVQPAGSGGKGRVEAIRLHASDSVQVHRQPAEGTIRVCRVTIDPASFVRVEQFSKIAEQRRLRPLDRWIAYSKQLRRDSALVAYYTFEKAGANNSVLPNLSSAGGVLDGHVEGAEWVYGRLPGKYALMFHGPNSGDKVILPEQQRFNFAGPFSIAMWLRSERFPQVCQALITKGDASWRLYLYDHQLNGSRLAFDTDNAAAPIKGGKSEHRVKGQTSVGDGQWHLAVVTYEPLGDRARKRLYVDGRLDAEDARAPLLAQNADPVWLGANSGWPGHEFRNWIDEVAILSRALSAEEVTAIFAAGNPAADDTHQKPKGGPR